MSNESIKAVAEGIPEFFYDIMAYVIPGLYLIFGLGLVLEVFENFSLESIKLSENFVLDAFILLASIGALYLLGQLLTTFSSLVVWKLPVWIFNKIIPPHKIIKFHENIDWYDGYRKLEINKLRIAGLVTKRYSRWVASRNVVFANLVLIIINLIFHKPYGIILLGLLLVFSLDTALRKVWLNKYINKLVCFIKTESLNL
jgi:hypothetical protein